MAVMTQFWPRLRFALQQSGWQGRLGLVMWLAAILLSTALASELHKQHVLTAQLTQAVQKTEMVPNRVVQGDVTQRFYALLPKKDEVNTLSERILHEADSMGLQFERAEFSENKSTDTFLVLHQIKLPVRGNYLQIRQFLNNLLNAQPALALTEFKVHRDDVFTDLVEANLELKLYLRGDAN